MPRSCIATALVPELQERIEAWRELRFRVSPISACRPSNRERVAGWYDSQTKHLFIDPSAPGRFGEGVLLHELVHALQDDHFNLEALHRHAADTEEGPAALATILEGEALLAVMELLDFDFEHVVDEMTSAGERIPADATPYVDGSRFIRELRDRCGWPGVDHMFRNPPHNLAEVSLESLGTHDDSGTGEKTCPDRFRDPGSIGR
jgi:hypothetical protein